MLQDLEFFVPQPELSYLKVCPSVVCLPPRQGARIEVSFCPPKALPERGGPSRDALQDANDDNNQEKQDGDAYEAGAGAAAAAAPSGGPVGKGPSKKGEDKTKAGAAAAASNNKNAIVPTPSEGEAAQDKEGGTAEAAADGGTQGEGQDENGLPVVPLYAGALDEGGLMDCEEGNDGEQEEEETQEPWSRHGRWRVPCFLKSAGAHGVGGNGTQEAGREGGQGREALLPPLALEVRLPSGRICGKKRWRRCSTRAWFLPTSATFLSETRRQLPGDLAPFLRSSGERIPRRGTKRAPA